MVSPVTTTPNANRQFAGIWCAVPAHRALVVWAIDVSLEPIVFQGIAKQDFAQPAQTTAALAVFANGTPIVTVSIALRIVALLRRHCLASLATVAVFQAIALIA